MLWLMRLVLGMMVTLLLDSIEGHSRIIKKF
jgi:hypothetical protein